MLIQFIIAEYLLITRINDAHKDDKKTTQSCPVNIPLFTVASMDQPCGGLYISSTEKIQLRN